MSSQDLKTKSHEDAAQVCDQACPLCESQGAILFHQDNNKRTNRPYYRCINCHLVFVPAAFCLSEAEEKAEYDFHENKLGDSGYQRFLMRFWEPFKSILPDGASILEFGCGPGPVLASMMEDDGYDVVLFDHFYRPDQSVIKPLYYDGISSTEVIEHVHQPKKTIELLLGSLKPSGVLGLMTKMVESSEKFKTWHYKNDLTHVCFYSELTFQWIAYEYNLQVSFYGADVILLQK